MSQFNVMGSDLNNPCGSILVFGGSGIDYIAHVSSFPERDSKIRTQEARILVGGNAANTSAALARLGVNCRLVSKIGSDANAQFLLSSLSSSMGVIVDDIITGGGGEDGTNEITAFTYVLVCQESLSRTCIHTPLLSEISQAEITKYIEEKVIYNDYEYVHFDSRHTEAAVTLAEHFHRHTTTQKSAILSIDLEKSRPHLPNLIQYCHIIFTNKTGIKDMFPSFSGTTDDDFLLQAASFLSDSDSDSDGGAVAGAGAGADTTAACCRLVVMTDGSRGSTVLFRHPLHDQTMTMQPSDSDSDLLAFQFATLNFQDMLMNHHAESCTTNDKDKPCVGFSSELKHNFNMIANNVINFKYANLKKSTDSRHSLGVIRSFAVDAADIVDSTGAGDAYIGGFLFGLLHRASLQESMILGTIVATEGLCALGAQTNLPSLARVLSVITSRSRAPETIATESHI